MIADKIDRSGHISRLKPLPATSPNIQAVCAPSQPQLRHSPLLLRQAYSIAFPAALNPIGGPLKDPHNQSLTWIDRHVKIVS